MRIKPAISRLKQLAHSGVVLAVAGALLLPVAAVGAAPDTGDITGTVTNQSGAAISNVPVWAYASVDDYNNGQQAGAAWTDGSGNYDLSGLAAGTYFIEFNDQSTGDHHDYMTQFYNNQPTIDTADPVTVVTNTTVSGINARLATAGQISGTVTGTSGTALDNIRVDVYASADDFKNNNPSVGLAQTDSTGSYDVGGLASGTYLVVFDQQGGGNPDYVQQFYNGKATADSANLVTVTTGATTTGINAQVATAGHITGKVTDPNGASLANIRVTAFASVADYGNGVNNGGVANADTGADGTYNMGSLPAGNYLIVFTPDDSSLNLDYEFYPGQRSIGLAQPVTVTAGMTTPDINAVLTVPGHITGKVTGTSGSPLANVTVKVYATVYDYENGIRVGSTHTDADGTYDVMNLHPGNYIVVFNQSYQHDMMYYANYETQFYNNQSTVESADPVVVTAGNITPDINAILKALAPTTKDQCKGGGWRQFTDPSFKNQGQCVSYVEHHT